MNRRIATVLLLATGALPSLTGIAAAGKPRKQPPADTTPPSVTIKTPASGATLAGAISATGSAADNVQVAKVELSVDGGPYSLVSGTTTWSRSLDTTAYADGSHVIIARATDTAGNATVSSVSVSFANAPAPAPAPAPDTSPPSVSITSPASGATIGGAVSVSGTASDDSSVAKVELSVDGGTYQPAQGTNPWGYALDTSGYADGSHTISVRATDSAGNVSSTGESVTVKNSTTLPSGVTEQMVTPEGLTIQICSGVTGWTAQQIYDLLKPSAFELSRIGPHLTIKVQTTYASQTTSSASGVNGTYTSFRSTMYLQASPGTTFTTTPDYIAAHEYGHAWATYHLYLSHQGDWTPYLDARSLTNDPRLDSTFNWSRNEMIADDYRMLFGDAAAVSEAAYVNWQVPDPRTVPGLRDFFLNVWAVP